LLKDILRHIINHTGTIRGIASVATKYVPKDSPIENSLLVTYAKIKKLFSSLIYFCVSALSFKYTQELKHDVLDCIEKDIAHYNKLGNSLLCGDFNARISCENDFILNDESKFTPIYEDYKTDKNILKRQSRDTEIDQRGKELLDLF
jgi:hypothetical protein